MDVSRPWKPFYGRIEIRRQSGGIGSLLPWRIYVDGEIREHVRRSETVSIMVEAGEHLVQIHSGLSVSHRVTVTVAEGQRVILVSRPQQPPSLPEVTTLARAEKSSSLRRVRIDLEQRK